MTKGCAVVTGASFGIGLAFARELARRGFRRVRELGEIELLVNSTRMTTPGDFFGTDKFEEIGAIRLNAEAVVKLTHEVLRGMVPSVRGAIINLASVVGFQPFPHFAVYAASKAFLLSFTEFHKILFRKRSRRKNMCPWFLLGGENEAHLFANLISGGRLMFCRFGGRALICGATRAEKDREDCLDHD